MPNVFDFNPTSINHFPYWKWNKVLPAVYDDSLSQYEILCKLLDTVNTIITSTNSTGEQVEQLTQLVQQLIDGKFPSGIVSYVEQIAQAAIEGDITAINTVISKMQSDIDALKKSIRGQIGSINEKIETMYFYNVMDYGAVGNGVADDTAAIQSAIDACSEGGTVYFPTGRGYTFKVSHTLNITKPYIKIACDNIPSVSWERHGIKFYAASKTSILFNVTAAGCTFNNIQASSSTQFTGIFAICRTNSADTDVEFDNCFIVNFHIAFQHFNRGFKLFNSDIANCDNCIEIRSDSYITGSGQQTVRGIVIRNNRFHHMYNAIYVFSTVTYGMVITDNLIDFYPSVYNGNVLLVDSSTDDSTIYHNLTVVGNTVLNCANYMIDVWKVISGVITNNALFNRNFAGQGGIRIRAELQQCVISSNTISGCNYDGIYVHHMQNSIINGNVIFSTARSSVSNSNGAIRVSYGFGFVIDGNYANVMTPSIATPIVLDSDSSYTNSVVQNNTSHNQSSIVALINNPTLTNCKFQSTITG